MLLDRSNQDEEFAASFIEFGVTVKKLWLTKVQGPICKSQGLISEIETKMYGKQVLGHVAFRGWPKGVRRVAYIADGHKIRKTLCGG